MGIMKFVYLFQSFSKRVIFWIVLNKLLNRKMINLKYWQQLLSNKKAIEIGGPSSLFSQKGYLPIYNLFTTVDGVNFNQKTVWEGTLKEGMTYKYESSIGYQYIMEATDLSEILSSSYDVVLSCNNLEHIANPLKAIIEWKRVLSNKGLLVLVLPNKKGNFDHKRAYTTFEHLIQDFEGNTQENDLTHLQEVLEKHDLQRDPHAGTFEEFKRRCEANIENRCMHHHVFNDNLLNEILEYCGFKVLYQIETPKDFFILGMKN